MGFRRLFLFIKAHCLDSCSEIQYRRFHKKEFSYWRSFLPHFEEWISFFIFYVWISKLSHPFLLFLIKFLQELLV